jgi:hypothetical protein
MPGLCWGVAMAEASIARRRWSVGRVLRLALIVYCAALLLPVVVALGRAAVECRMVGGTPAQPTTPPGDAGGYARDIAGYARPEDQSYLTLPEWYIVYSSEEYARFIGDNPPSQFPYFGAVGQYWQSYYEICAVTRDDYPLNGGYHLMLAVIGTSFTVENIGRGLYENSIGRVSEALSSPELTEEDAYAHAVATEYGAFIHTIPWYDFPFWQKLRGLWSETSLWGPNPVRKFERKLALSFEYIVKGSYGWVLRQGTEGVYGAADTEILAWAEGVTPELVQSEPRLRVVEPLGEGEAIVAIPHYELFTQITPGLLRQGMRFREIAGNDEILITVIGPRPLIYEPANARYLFALPILTEPSRERIAIAVPVAELDEVLASFEGSDIVLEHIYDY